MFEVGLRQALLRRLAQKGSPAREDHRLGALPGLPGYARHMWKVGSPLPAVQPVLPVLSYPHPLPDGHMIQYHLCWFLLQDRALL